MIYRKGTFSDIEKIISIVKSAILEMESHGIIQWNENYPVREDFIHDMNEGALFIAEQENEIAAFYVISKECDEAYSECQWKFADEESCVIHRFCVNPKFQNNGIGKKVLLHIEEHLKSLGFKSARLDVFSKNPFAISLYEKNGYERRGSAQWIMGLFYLMEKKLDD